MKYFKIWLEKDSKKTGFLYDEAAEREREKGWRAALDFAKKEAISLDERGAISRGIINAELES